MKKKVAIVAISFSLLAFSSVAPAADACEVVLCMYGKMVGKSQSECRSAEKDYFKIQVKKKGKFKAGKTADARLAFLNQCPSPENSKINKKFGKLRG